MSEKQWVPAIYLDEITPPPRTTATAWAVALPEGDFALAPADDEIDEEDRDPPTALKDGDIVQFSWFVDLGRAGFLIKSLDKTLPPSERWAVDREPPTPPEGGHLFVMETGDSETMMDGLAEFAEAYIDNGYGLSEGEETTIAYYSWSSGSVPFEFRAGEFHQIEAA